MHLLTRTFYLLLICSLLVTGCQVQGKDLSDPGKRDITRRDLFRAARAHNKTLLVYGLESEEYTERLKALVNEINQSDRGGQILLRHHLEVSEDDLTELPVLLLGTPSQNRWIKELSQDLPFDIRHHAVVFDGKEYETDDFALVVSYYPNPLNVKLPISLIISLSESALWDEINKRITTFNWGSWNYEILRHQQRILLGNFSQQSQNRWEIDPQQQIQLPSGPAHQWQDGPFRFRGYHGSLGPDSVKSLIQECQKAMVRITEFIDTEEQLPLMDYHLYPDTELKGLMTGNTDQSHIDFEHLTVHAACNENYLERHQGKENLLVIRKLLGQASHQVLETGLAIYFTQSWEKEGYQYWAKLLIQGDNGLRVNQLFDADTYQNSSTLIREALAASLVQFLIDDWGRQLFLKKYASWDPSKEEMSQLTKAWWDKVKASESWLHPVGRKDLPYLRGFNFTHEGYQIFNGYGSQMSDNSLHRLYQMGTNAVAIVPYSGMRDPEVPSVLHFSRNAGGENDEGVINVINKAKSLGMFTILKPHVWIRGSWPGEVTMESDSSWNQFFDNYYRWISHYALMAEMHNIDMLCIGVEFVKATLHHEHRWRDLISRIRKIYSGNLIYAANWGDEFENLAFWDALDYIGLNCYYPLSDRSNASLSELQKGFEKTLEKVQAIQSRYNKPLVLTEIGFRSVEAPWKQPHETAADKPYNQDHQALAYQAVFQALENNEAVEGILWWKWPTVMEHEEQEDRRFIPYAKKTEPLIEQWFRRMETVHGGK